MESIAMTIRVHKSTVSRELKRNSTANGKYVWSNAHIIAGIRKERTPGNRRLDDALNFQSVNLSIHLSNI